MEPAQSVQSPNNNPATEQQTGIHTITNHVDNITTTDSFTTVSSPPLSALYTSVQLLKTAIADISAGITTVEGHILFDEDAQKPFIAQELASILQLQLTRHKVISVSSFGAQVSTPTRFAAAAIDTNLCKTILYMVIAL